MSSRDEFAPGMNGAVVQGHERMARGSGYTAAAKSLEEEEAEEGSDRELG